jgi:hypothetical protein
MSTHDLSILIIGMALFAAQHAGNYWIIVRKEK